MNRELTGTIYVSIAIFIASFFSYLLQYYLGRHLSIPEYGSFNALLSIAYIISVPAAVLTTSLIKKVSDLNALGEFGYLTRMFVKLSQLAVITGIVIFIVILFFSHFISEFLRISDVSSVAVFGLFMSTALLGSIPQAYLQGILRYKAFAFYTVLTGLLRFAFPVLFLLLGFGVKGSFAGLFVCALVSYLIATLILKKNFVETKDIHVRGILNDIFNFAVPVLVINLCMMILNNIDLILVKNYFDPQLAGYYAGTITLGKILLFGAGTVTVIMFPKIATLRARGESVIKMFNFFFALQLAIVLVSIGVFSVLPTLITSVFFGTKFNESINYLPLFSVFIGIYVLINFLVMFMLAIEKTDIYKFLIPAIVLQILLIVFFHSTLFNVIYANIIAASLVLAALLIKTKVALNTPYIKSSPNLTTL